MYYVEHYNYNTDKYFPVHVNGEIIYFDEFQKAIEMAKFVRQNFTSSSRVIDSILEEEQIGLSKIIWRSEV